MEDPLNEYIKSLIAYTFNGKVEKPHFNDYFNELCGIEDVPTENFIYDYIETPDKKGRC